MYTKEEAIKELKKIIKLNTEINVIMHKVSASGMTRKMSVIMPVKCQWQGKNKTSLHNMNYLLKQAEIVKLDKNQHIIVGGCGMDMMFHLSYTIKALLYGNDKALKNQQYKSFY